MMMKRIISFAVVLALWTGAATFGQEKGEIRNPPPVITARPGGPHSRELLYARLAEYLKLSGETSRRFQAVFNEYGEVRWKLMKEQIELFRKISHDVEDDSVSAADLKTLADRYRIINRSLWRERENFLKRSGEILDDRQMVKLLIFEDKVKEDLFRRLRPGGNSGPDGLRARPGQEPKIPVRPR